MQKLMMENHIWLSTKKLFYLRVWLEQGNEVTRKTTFSNDKQIFKNDFYTMIQEKQIYVIKAHAIKAPLANQEVF